MSRSYRKYPCVKDGAGHKNRTSGTAMKTIANRAVRRKNMEIGGRQKGLYKKYFESYNICDYKWDYTLAQARADWEAEESLPEEIERVYWTIRLNPETNEYEDVKGSYTHRCRPLHDAYGTLEKFLNDVKKDYYRK